MVTDRPWRGADAITGLTMRDFVERLRGVKASSAATRAAVGICRAYNIRGWSDPGYIANVIQAEVKRSLAGDVSLRLDRGN